jgi:hypothetical protein
MIFRKLFATLSLLAVSALLLFAQTVGASAQVTLLEVPWAKEWASSMHALSSAEAFNHWNSEGAVPATCARCHTTTGFQDYIGADGSPVGSVEKDHLTGQVIACVACHNSVTRELSSVTFPSGLTVENLGAEARCMTCHQGRESTVSVNNSVQDMDEDAVSGKLRFLNIHYRAAAATRYGTEAKGGYEYDGKTYVGLFEHDKDATVCSDCHTLHTFRVDVDNCNLCHRAVETKSDFVDIRRTEVDFNGNGDISEGIAAEVRDMHGKLLAAMQVYGAQVAGQAIAYNANSYPYFFADKNGDGVADASEAVSSNGYKNWTPRLLKAAYNYQFVAKDPGAFTHNPAYVLQLMYDGIESLSQKAEIDMAGLLRP